MSVCEACQGEMLTVDGCIKTPIPIWTGKFQLRLTNSGRSAVRTETTKKVLEPIPYGKETRFKDLVSHLREELQGRTPMSNEKGRCHDCGALPGYFHHTGCDVEECPGCHQQMLMCGGECGEKT